MCQFKVCATQFVPRTSVTRQLKVCVMPPSDTSADFVFAKFSAACAAGKTECKELLACIK